MKENKMSAIVKEMAQQILLRDNASREAIDVAINIVHIAWNFAHEDKDDEPGYIYGIKEMQERIGAVKNEFISDNVEELTEKLMRYKLKKHPNDKRTIFTCEFKNGNIKVTSR